MGLCQLRAALWLIERALIPTCDLERDICLHFVHLAKTVPIRHQPFEPPMLQPRLSKGLNPSNPTELAARVCLPIGILARNSAETTNMQRYFGRSKEVN